MTVTGFKLGMEQLSHDNRLITFSVHAHEIEDYVGSILSVPCLRISSTTTINILDDLKMAELLLMQTISAQNMRKPQAKSPAEEQRVLTNEATSAFPENPEVRPHSWTWKAVQNTCTYSLWSHKP